jgi:hypothetical protein
MELDTMRNLFLTKFSLPDDSEHYDSHEGGFLNYPSFIETEDAIKEVFKNLSEKNFKKLLSELNKISSHWVKK